MRNLFNTQQQQQQQQQSTFNSTQGGNNLFAQCENSAMNYNQNQNNQSSYRTYMPLE